MKSKILIILLFCSNLLFAQSITVTGYGNSKDKALKSAFQNAVEQEVGVLVDTKTVIRNNKLIKNKILTYSNGFIKDYKEVSSKQQMGFWTVKINAVVESQKLLSKIKKIKLKPKKITGTKKLYAQVVSQVKTKFDAEDLLKKFYRTFTSVPIESYYAEVTEFDIDTDLATRKTVPVTIKCSVRYSKSPIVKRQLKEAHDFLKKLAVGYSEKKDISVMGIFKGTNPKSYPNRIKGQLLPLNNTAYFKNIAFFGFPRSYSVVYPFNQRNGFGMPKRHRKGYVIISALDKNGKVLKKWSKRNHIFKLESMVTGLQVSELELIPKENNYVIKWKMPTSYLKRIAQVKATIKWI